MKHFAAQILSLFSQVSTVVANIIQFNPGNKIDINFVRCFSVLISHLRLGLLVLLLFQDFKILKKKIHFTHTECVIVSLFNSFKHFNDIIWRVKFMKLFIMPLFSSSLYFKILLGIILKCHKRMLTAPVNKIINKCLSLIQKQILLAIKSHVVSCL
jgi:hypothetical protein